MVKNLATAYYGKAPGYSYIDGCSTGGLQGFSEAQRFPGDFDGILAGAPAVDFNPQRDLPRAGGERQGFTDDELKLLDVIYGPTNVGKTKVYPGTVIGGEFPGLTYLGGTYEPVVSQSAWEGRAVPDSQGMMEQQFILAMRLILISGLSTSVEGK